MLSWSLSYCLEYLSTCLILFVLMPTLEVILHVVFVRMPILFLAKDGIRMMRILSLKRRGKRKEGRRLGVHNTVGRQ